jgi:phosphatidylinositol alpha-mannosyltransferase
MVRRAGCPPAATMRAAAVPMKIGIVTEYYYPLLGGITEHVHNTALRLRARGHSVTIITSNVGDNRMPPGEALAPAAEVIRIGRSIAVHSNRSVAHATLGLHLWRDLRRVFLREQFDIAHLHSPLVVTLPALSVLASSCRSLGTFHTYFEGSRVYAAFRHVFQRRFLDKLDGRSFVSQSCIVALERYFRLRDSRIIPNGIDTTMFSPSVPRLESFDDRKRTLLFLGRFDRRNGLGLMLHAFALVRRSRPDVRLIVVGGGKERPLFEQRVPDDLRPDVHFVGPVLASRPRYYATCDVFCSPIDTASFGVTLLEAMASGKPVVATDNVGYRDLLSPDEGILVPPGDAIAFAQAITALIDDDARRRELGANGVRKAARYDWDRVVDQTLELYREIVSRP